MAGFLCLELNERERHERFDEWVREHGAILHHVANGFAEVNDRADLFQELLLALWKAAPAFRSEAKASTFIYRVAHNAALNWKRGRKTYMAKLALIQAEPVEAGSAGPDKELLERLYGEIRKLPPLDRSIILLALDGVSYASIADIHELTESNVGVRLHRLKARLAEAMKGFGS